MKATSSAEPAASMPAFAGVTPRSISVMAKKTSRMEGTRSAAPRASKAGRRSGARFRSTLRPTRNDTTPTGMLMRKMNSQGSAETMIPPRVGPHMAPSAVKVATRPSARPRPSGKVSVMMPWLLARLAAPPSDWMARATTSISKVGDRPHSAEPAVNSTTPTWKMRTLPNISPRRPKTSSAAQVTTA